MSVRTNITQTDNYILGEDKQLQFLVVDSAGSAQTMTGWALEFIVRSDPDSASTAISKTTASGIAISNGNGTDDRATVTIADDDTVALRPGLYYYAIRRTDAGSEQVLAFGTVELVQAVTR